ncbi:MAG: hypothetical protein KKC99_10125 [Proteobacteria bacterium]|nr:hypothetical protein [Pseudomonadota bacterium]
MNREVDIPTPIPVNSQLTKWEGWSGLVYFFAVVIVTSIAIWHLPATHPIAPLVLLGIGILFDAFSLAVRISNAVTGRYSSGFFLIGFAFYLWAWLSYPRPVLINDVEGLVSLWLCKLPDIACIVVAHLLIHFSFGSERGQKAKEQDTEQFPEGEDLKAAPEE